MITDIHLAVKWTIGVRTSNRSIYIWKYLSKRFSVFLQSSAFFS